MTKANEFLRALRTARGGEQGVEEFWQRQKTAWLADLRFLRETIRGWMRSVEDAGFAVVADTDFPITEPDVGYYLAPGLVIEVLVKEPRRVLVQPRGLRIAGVVEADGRRIVGAIGRVDLECGATRQILLRFPREGATAWASYAGGAKRDLDEDLFFELLARTADVAMH